MNLFLFIRAKTDIASACHSVGEFISFRIKTELQLGDVLAGIWIDPSFIDNPPDKLTCNISPRKKIEFKIKESFSLSGIWTLCCIDPVSFERINFSEIPRNVIIKALMKLNKKRAKVKDTGCYAPVFPLNTHINKVRSELKKLQSQYENMIESPVFYDQNTGLISIVSGRNLKM